MNVVRFVATMMGRYDILVITLVKDGGELIRLVNEEIMTLPGVKHADTTLAVKVLSMTIAGAESWVSISLTEAINVAEYTVTNGEFL